MAIVSSVTAAEVIPTEQFVTNVATFLEREIAAHVAAVPSIDPPPPLVLGVPTEGNFTWGSFMRAIAECSALSGRRNIAGRDVPQFLGQLGLIEARQGGKTFAQLGVALALRHFGTNLATNPLWQSLTSQEQTQWRSLLDPGRFYDRTTRHVINLPKNYFGVAAHIVTMDYQMGLVTDRDFCQRHRDAGCGPVSSRRALHRRQCSHGPVRSLFAGVCAICLHRRASH